MLANNLVTTSLEISTTANVKINKDLSSHNTLLIDQEDNTFLKIIFILNNYEKENYIVKMLMSCYSTKAQRVHTLTLSSLEYTDLHRQKCFKILVHSFTFVQKN